MKQSYQIPYLHGKRSCSTCLKCVSHRCQRSCLQLRRKAILLKAQIIHKETLIQRWRNVLRTHAQIFNKFQRNSLAGPWELWSVIYGLGFFHELLFIIIYIITAVLSINIIFIQLIHNIIIILQIKASSRNGIRKKTWKWQAATSSWIKEYCKAFCQMSRIRPFTTRPAPQLYISSKHFALLQICVKIFHSHCYLVAMRIHIKSLRT
jgi:hypothetical protein